MNTIRFNLIGLLCFSAVLIAGTTAASFYFRSSSKPYYYSASGIPEQGQQDKDVFIRRGPWGEILTQNIHLERPAEFFGSKALNPEPQVWTFASMSEGEIKELLIRKGLTKEQAESLKIAAKMRLDGSNVKIEPDEDALFALPAQARSALYENLTGMNVNSQIENAFHFPAGTYDSIIKDPALAPEDVVLFKQLVYRVDTAYCFADLNLLMRRIPTVERRMPVAKAISREPAVLVRVCVRPDTDIDKMVSYWGNTPNVRVSELRPMLEALKRLKQGGTVGLSFFLSPFVRERLYSYPLPPQAGEPSMDCHWSSMNFANTQPDNRFSDPTYVWDFIRKNYYEIGYPTVCGDLIVFFDERSAIKHSAVFLADDLAFSKNGGSFLQPWLVTRIADLQAMYPKCKLVYFRRKTE